MTTAGQLLSKRVVTGRAEDRLSDVAMRMRDCSAQMCVVLSEAGRFLGLIRLPDVAMRTGAGQRILADLLTAPPPLQVDRATPAETIPELFNQNRVHDAVVISGDGQYVGVITAESLVDWMHQEQVNARHEIELLLEERERLNLLLEKKVEERTAALRATVEGFKTTSASFSHDVRSPLRSIQTYADILLSGEHGPLDPEGRVVGENIKRAAARLESLAHDVLDQAQRSFASHPARPEEVDLNEVLDDIMQFHSALFAARKAVISRRGSLHVVTGRYIPFLQIFANLVANAVKYVPEDRQPLVEVWSEEVNGRMRICVRDNGRGISDENARDMFEPFAREGGPSRDGLGLGLAIAQSAARSLGGSIGFESEVGLGSTFMVILPSQIGTPGA